MKRNAGRNKKSASRRNALHRELRGRTFSPPNKPPIVQVGHWNNAVIVLRNSGDLEPTINTWANTLRDSWGLYASDASNRVPIALRFVSFSFWLFDSVLPQPFQVKVRDLENFGEMIRLQDFPGRNSWARVGYEWPAHQAFIQHDHDDSTNHPIAIDVTSSAVWLCHMTVLWRPLNAASYTDTLRGQEDFKDGPSSSGGWVTPAFP